MAIAETLTTDAADCPVCSARGRPETYWYMRHQYVFDVDRARQFTSDGREPYVIERESVEASVALSEIHSQHVAHVDPSIPGIISHLWFADDNGEIVHGHLLIDGNHRAAHCLEAGLPFLAYVLSEEESRAILLRGQDGRRSALEPAAIPLQTIS